MHLSASQSEAHLIHFSQHEDSVGTPPGPHLLGRHAESALISLGGAGWSHASPGPTRGVRHWHIMAHPIQPLQHPQYSHHNIPLYSHTSIPHTTTTAITSSHTATTAPPYSHYNTSYSQHETPYSHHNITQPPQNLIALQQPRSTLPKPFLHDQRSFLCPVHKFHILETYSSLPSPH